MLRPIHLDPALIGQRLPFDLFSESGVLLAGAGMLLADEAHFQKLVSRPLYQKTQPGAESIQPLHRLSELGNYTSALFAGPEQGMTEEELRLLARAFLALYRFDPEACLGFPRLSPVAKPYLNHCLQALFIAVLLADHLDFPEAEIESLAAAAMTMNIASIPLHERLHNQNGFVTNEDWLQLRAHPEASAALLERVGVTDKQWLDTVRQHHENMDGSGYPSNSSGAQISMTARVLHVADLYCGKINARHYRPPKSPRSAFKELFGDMRTHIDTQIATLLLRRIGLLPLGTLVRLSNRENACITRLGHNGQHRYAVSFMDPRGHPLDSPRDRDIETRAYAIRSLIDYDPAWPKINWSLLWGY